MKKIILLWVFLLFCPNCFSKDCGLKIHFIDTGEGDCILIQTREDSALIDAGNLLSGYKLADYLKKYKITALKHLVITHHHPDHFMGIFFIIPGLKIENFYDNGNILDNLNDSNLSAYEKIFRSQKNYHILKEGDTLQLGEVILEIIWPPDLKFSADFNRNSLVIMLNYRDFRCLLAADIDKAAETELLKRRETLNADVLKVSHHGSDDATSQDFIKKVAPRFAIISVDKNNLRGYPSKKILDLLKENNITAYRTDECGSIIISANNKTDCVILPEKPH